MAELPNPKSALAKAQKAKANGPSKPVTAASVATNKTSTTIIPFADKPVEGERAPAATATIVLPPVAPAAPAHPAPIELTAAAPTPVAANLEESTMNNTMNTTNDTMRKVEETANATANTMHDAAQNAGNKATEVFGDMNARAKDAMAKGTKAIEEFVEFSKENMEALATSSRVAAKGAEEIAKYSAEFGRSSIEKANATAKQFASVKSPTEFFQLQGEVAKQTLDALVAEGSKFTENYLKLLGEVTQPISNRVAVAADKIKPTTNA